MVLGSATVLDVCRATVGVALQYVNGAFTLVTGLRVDTINYLTIAAELLPHFIPQKLNQNNPATTKKTNLKQTHLK